MLSLDDQMSEKAIQMRDKTKQMMNEIYEEVNIFFN